MRPLPPVDLVGHHVGRFLPAPDVADWLMSSFIADGAELQNDDHAHLRFADLGVLWTNVPNGRGGRSIIGQCEPGVPRAMGRWAKARAEQQVVDWFGSIPDFIITLDANYSAQCGDAEFCALVEHELYHAGQERDEFGQPKFRRSGLPAFGMRGHDCEEFIGVVRRYGADAAGIRQLVEAASRPPEIGAASMAQVCGTCLLRAA